MSFERAKARLEAAKEEKLYDFAAAVFNYHALADLEAALKVIAAAKELPDLEYHYDLADALDAFEQLS